MEEKSSNYTLRKFIHMARITAPPYQYGNDRKSDRYRFAAVRVHGKYENSWLSMELKPGRV